MLTPHNNEHFVSFSPGLCWNSQVGENTGQLYTLLSQRIFAANYRPELRLVSHSVFNVLEGCVKRICLKL